MKAFVVVGNTEIENMLQETALEIVDTSDNLTTAQDLLEFLNIDIIILNRLLEDTGEKIIEIAKQARKKKTKIIMLIDTFEGYDDRKLITNLVNEGVTAFVLFEELTAEKIEGIVKSYPKEFDFTVFSQIKAKEGKEDRKEKSIITKHQYIEKVNKGLKRTIAVFSAAPTGKSFITNNLAYTLANKGIETTVVDADFKNRAMAYYFYIDNEKENKGLKELMELEFLEDLEAYGFDIIENKLNVYTVPRFDEELSEIDMEFMSDRFMLLLDYLKTEKDVVLIDMGCEINENTKEIISAADTILYVQNMDYRMLEQNKGIVKQLSRNNASLIKKMVLVLNQFQEMKEFSQKEIVEYLDIDFLGIQTIPVDPAMAVKNIRYGKAAVAMKECSEEMKESFESLAEYCYGIRKEVKPKNFMTLLFK